MRKALIAVVLLSSVLLIAAAVSGCGGSSSVTPTASSRFAFVRWNGSGGMTFGYGSCAGYEPGILPGPIDVYTMLNNGAPGSEQKMTSETAMIYEAQLSRDGNKGVFTAWTCSDSPWSVAQVFAVDMANPNNPVQLTNGDTTAERAQISPDGSKVLYRTPTTIDGYLMYELWVLSSSGGTPNKVSLPQDFSPDQAAFGSSTQLVVAGWNRSDRVYKMYSANIDGSGLVQLISTPNFVSDPSVSPDSSKIVFVRSNETNGNFYTMDIWIMDSNGQNVKRLTNNGISYDPMFVNDKIVFIGDVDNDRGTEVYSMNFDGSGITQLTNTEKLDFFSAYSGWD